VGRDRWISLAHRSVVHLCAHNLRLAFTVADEVTHGTWTTDYPEADKFHLGLREWAGTNLKIAPRPEQIKYDDKFLITIIYFVEPGFLELSPEQAARLREYVARGGFMFFDDFWGVYEWENLETQLKKIWPEGGYEPKDLPLSHPIFHSYLDVEEVVQVPNVYNAMRGETSEKGGIVPHYMGVEDKNGRIVTFSFLSTAI
jgi:hypothetical protein